MSFARLLRSCLPGPVWRGLRALRLAVLRLIKGRTVTVTGPLGAFRIAYGSHSEYKAARRFRTFEPGFLDSFETALPRSRCVLDIGGYIGLYTLTAATAPNRPVVAVFEPNTRNFASIQANLALNGVEGVRMYPCAVGREEGTVRISGAVGETASVLAEGAGGGTATGLVSIDALVRRGEIPPPDLIKIDVEGYELHVAQGLEETLRLHRPLVLVEIHPLFMTKFGVTEEALDTLFAKAGYRKEVLRKPGEGGDSPHRQTHAAYHPPAEGSPSG